MIMKDITWTYFMSILAIFLLFIIHNRYPILLFMSHPDEQLCGGRCGDCSDAPQWWRWCNAGAGKSGRRYVAAHRVVAHQPPWATGSCWLKTNNRARLSIQVIHTIQAASAGSTTAYNKAEWLGFQPWCEERSLNPWHSSCLPPPVAW